LPDRCGQDDGFAAAMPMGNGLTEPRAIAWEGSSVAA